MGIEAPANVKFALIAEAMKADDNLLNISWMCEIAGVSRAGYYAWQKAEPTRQAREAQDRRDYDRILEAYRFRGYDKGAKGIHMRLLHLKPPVRMNLKKIRRLMRKFGLICPIRAPNPYRALMRDMRTSHVAPNVVKRNFHQGVRKVLLTDITYLFYKGGVCYLSTILDAFTHEVLAYQLSESLKVDFVIETVNALIDKHGATLDTETIVHSDQGCHYTSNAFIEKLRDEAFVQSMSRKGNCWDNAPQESFFGHMKDEIREMIAVQSSFAAVQCILDDWMDYYNNDRYQWELKKLSPREYYDYVVTGLYPLPVYAEEASSAWGAAPNPEV